MARAYSHDVLVMFNSGFFFFFNKWLNLDLRFPGPNIIFYDTFLHKHTPKVITHLLKHQGSISQRFNLQSKFIHSTKDTGSYWGLPPKYRSIWSGSGWPRKSFIFCPCIYTHILALLTSFFCNSCNQRQHPAWKSTRSHGSERTGLK